MMKQTGACLIKIAGRAEWKRPGTGRKLRNCNPLFSLWDRLCGLVSRCRSSGFYLCQVVVSWFIKRSEISFKIRKRGNGNEMHTMNNEDIKVISVDINSTSGLFYYDAVCCLTYQTCKRMFNPQFGLIHRSRVTLGSHRSMTSSGFDIHQHPQKLVWFLFKRLQPQFDTDSLAAESDFARLLQEP